MLLHLHLTHETGRNSKVSSWVAVGSSHYICSNNVTLTNGRLPQDSHTISGWKRNIFLSCSETTKCRNESKYIVYSTLRHIASQCAPWNADLPILSVSTDFPCGAWEFDKACVYHLSRLPYTLHFLRHFRILTIVWTPRVLSLRHNVSFSLNRK